MGSPAMGPRSQKGQNNGSHRAQGPLTRTRPRQEQCGQGRTSEPTQQQRQAAWTSGTGGSSPDLSSSIHKGHQLADEFVQGDTTGPSLVLGVVLGHHGRGDPGGRT